MQKFETLRQPLLWFWITAVPRKEEEEWKNVPKILAYGCQTPSAQRRSDQNIYRSYVAILGFLLPKVSSVSGLISGELFQLMVSYSTKGWVTMHQMCVTAHWKGVTSTGWKLLYTRWKSQHTGWVKKSSGTDANNISVVELGMFWQYTQKYNIFDRDKYNTCFNFKSYKISASFNRHWSYWAGDIYFNALQNSVAKRNLQTMKTNMFCTNTHKARCISLLCD